PYGQAQGSATMGQATLSAIFKNRGIGIPVATVPLANLAEHNAKNILLVTTIANQAVVQQAASEAQLLVVDSLVTTPEYDKMVDRIHQ
ncbi:PTS mannitol transporter subunit IIB, partial [Streptococcus danieliae]|nr:PTS mannitol transporter subunit IIB [Streptococcus danieliae]